ncbi:UTP--glucose-1-phosphate uridylyltransferase, partial [Tetrabaena socialis]
FFNTNNLWVSIDVLAATLEASGGALNLPLIKNKKTVNPRDAKSAPVFQLETAMGSAIECFDSAGALVVPRSRFAPVKTCSDLFVLRSDAYVIAEDSTVAVAPALAAAGRAVPLVRLDDGHYKLVDQLQLVAGVTGMVPEADIDSATGLPYLTDLPHVSPADAKPEDAAAAAQVQQAEADGAPHDAIQPPCAQSAAALSGSTHTWRMGCLSAASPSSSRFISGRLSGRPTMMEERQARDASMERTLHTGRGGHGARTGACFRLDSRCSGRFRARLRGQRPAPLLHRATLVHGQQRQLQRRQQRLPPFPRG